jgi:hypothetical protein
VEIYAAPLELESLRFGICYNYFAPPELKTIIFRTFRDYSPKINNWNFGTWMNSYSSQSILSNYFVFLAFTLIFAFRINLYKLMGI